MPPTRTESHPAVYAPQAVEERGIAWNDVGTSPAKRGMDLLFLLLGAPFALPVLAIVALAVAAERRGPVFFCQERVGRGGQKFVMWKFRSMVADADKVLEEHLAANPEARAEWAADQKLKDDPRITRLGGFLRCSSLDELPQLWNVLRGDMSLVGPRPLVRGESERYGKRYRYYLRARPGLTGLWQVSGRNDTTYAKRVELDAQYVREWRALDDVGILLRTVWVVISGRGAY